MAYSKTFLTAKTPRTPRTAKSKIRFSWRSWRLGGSIRSLHLFCQRLHDRRGATNRKSLVRCFLRLRRPPVATRRMGHPLPFTHHVLRITYHVSRIMNHVSRITSLAAHIRPLRLRVSAVQSVP